MSTEGYDSSKSNFDKAAENAKESFNDAANSAQNSANEFKQNFNQTMHNQDNKKVLAGIMGILFGYLGVHKFILGYNTEGFILLGVSLVSLPMMCIGIGFFTFWVPSLIGLIEGIIYLTKSDEEFYHTYQLNKKSWF